MTARSTKELRVRRHRRVRRRVLGTSTRPRLAVFRSNSHIYAQVIDDSKGITLASASTVADGKNGNKVESATIVGRLVAERLLALNIDSVVFDRGGFRYHGRVAAIAEAARAAGLKF